MPTFKQGLRGGYAGVSRDPLTGRDSHLIYFNPSNPGARNWAAWHELAHAMQYERDGQFAPTTEMSDAEYSGSEKEQEAERIASQYSDMDLWASVNDTGLEDAQKQPEAAGTF